MKNAFHKALFDIAKFFRKLFSFDIAVTDVDLEHELSSFPSPPWQLPEKEVFFPLFETVVTELR